MPEMEKKQRKKRGMTMEDIEKSMSKAEKKYQRIKKDNIKKELKGEYDSDFDFITIKKLIFISILGAIGIILYIL